MAEQKEELIIEINVTKSIENLGLMRQSLDQLIAQREELSEKSKAGDLESTKALEMLNSTIRNQQLEYKATQRVLDGYVQSKKKEADTINFANNSINQNKALLKQLTAQYNDLKNPSKEATEKIRLLSDELKKQESAVGNNTRNVGNYKESLIGAFKEIKGFGGVIDPIKNLGTAFEGAGGGVKGFGGALLATGLPIFILAMNSLIDVFKSFKPIAEGVENVMTGLATVFKAITSGGDIEKMVGANQALLEVMRDLEDTQGAFNIMQEKANTEIQRLIVSSKDRTKSDKDRLDLIKQTNDLEKKIFYEGLQRVADEVKSRSKKLIEDNKLSAQEYQILVYGTKQQALELQKRLSATSSYNEEELKLLQDKIKERSALEGQSAILQEKLANRTNQLQDEIKADQEKKRAEQEKRDEAEAKRIEAQNKRAELAASLYRKTQEEKFAALKKFDEDAKKNAEKAEADRIAELTTLYNTEKQFADKQLQLDLGYVDLSVATEEDKFKRKQEIQINYLEKQLDNAIQFLGADGSITKAELQGIEAIKLALAKAKAEMFPSKNGAKESYFSALGIDEETLKEVSGGLQVAGQVIDGISSIASAATQVRLNEIEAETNAEIEKVNQSTLSEEEKVKKISAINAKANKEKYEAEKAAFETNKAVQIIQAVISTALGVINGLNAGLSLGPAGLVMGPVLAALAAATGVAQIAVIASQSPPPPPNKFAKGVIGLDGDGSETSDSIPARLSKGESVITAKATKQFHRELAWMEQQVGNIPNYKFGHGNFANGLIGDGGYVARDTVRNADQSLMMSEAIRQGFRDIPSPTLSIVEFQNKVNSRNRSINISEA